MHFPTIQNHGRKRVDSFSPTETVDVDDPLFEGVRTLTFSRTRESNSNSISTTSGILRLDRMASASWLVDIETGLPWISIVFFNSVSFMLKTLLYNPAFLSVTATELISY